MRTFLEKIDPFVVFCFGLHDFASDFLAKHLFLVKRLLLIAAYVSLSGVLFPEFRKSFGSLAQLMLFLILFLSPVSKIFRARLLLQMMGLRREFGILMGCFALVHGTTYFVDPAVFLFEIAPYLNADFFSMQPLLYFGILSLILTMVLFVTSNDFSMRFLGGRRWKMLHRIVYILLLTVLAHSFFAENIREEYGAMELIQPIGIVFGYVLLKALAWKNSLPPLRDMIAYVSERYRAYALTKKSGNILTTPL